MGIMADSAKMAGATLNPFNQAKLQGIGGGECFGLSNAWLGYQAKGSSAFFTEIVSDQKNLRTDVQNYMKQQGSAVAKEAVAAKNGLKFEEKRFFDVETDDASKTLDAMSEWVGETPIKSRYFIVGTDKHVMALLGGGMGDKRFFDPNGGVAVCKNGATLKSFLNSFFGDLCKSKDARALYWVKGSKIDVTKHSKV
jgi:hypothetical protein